MSLTQPDILNDSFIDVQKDTQTLSVNESAGLLGWIGSVLGYGRQTGQTEQTIQPIQPIHTIQPTHTEQTTQSTQSTQPIQTTSSPGHLPIENNQHSDSSIVADNHQHSEVNVNTNVHVTANSDSISCIQTQDITTSHSSVESHNSVELSNSAESPTNTESESTAVTSSTSQSSISPNLPELPFEYDTELSHICRWDDAVFMIPDIDYKCLKYLEKNPTAKVQLGNRSVEMWALVKTITCITSTDILFEQLKHFFSFTKMYDSFGKPCPLHSIYKTVTCKGINLKKLYKKIQVHIDYMQVKPTTCK